MIESLYLVTVLAVSTAVLFLHDTMTARFFSNPDPDRTGRVRLFGYLSALATVGFYASFLFLLVKVGITVGLRLYPRLADQSSVLKTLIVVTFAVGLAIGQAVRRQISHIAGQTASGGVHAPIASVPPPNAGATLPQFAAMQYYALILNRTYNVFVADTMLCGAKVRGIVASPPHASSEMQDGEYWTRTLQQTLYERLDVTTPTFRKLNAMNFQIRWKDIARVEFNPAKKWGMGNVPHSGRIFIRLKSGRSRELILLGDQDGLAVKHMLAEAIAADASR